MASAFAANMANNTTDEEDNRDYPANALRVAAELEGGGAILQDYYHFEEYIHRRGTYIGKLPAYSHLPNACFVARRHASEIFNNEDKKLDVEEVRRREIAKGLDPLLPMPTTSNTATIDNFKTCVPKGVIWRLDYGDPDDEPSTAENAPQSTPATSPVANGTAESSKGQPDVHQGLEPGEAASHEAPAANEDLIDLSTPNFQGFRVPVAPMLAPQLHPIPPLQQTPGPIGSNTAQTAAATPLLPQHVAEAGEIATSPNCNNGATSQSKSPATASNAIPPKTSNSTPEKVFTPHPDVSSMAKFGIVSAVKPTKRSLETEPQASRDTTKANVANSTPAQEATIEPQATPNKTTSAPAPSNSPTDSLEPGPKRQRDRNGEARAIQAAIQEALNPKNYSEPNGTTTPKPTKTPAPPKPFAPAEAKPTPVDKKQQHLESVIAGTALPTTKAEAHAAAKEHHTRLLGASTAANSKGKARRTSARQAAANTPDCMPFFFSRDNFVIYDDDALGNVRCVCGCVDPDGGEKANEMVNCETCGVWQHYGCVLPGMSEKQVEGLKKFECTVCDPWGRREVLMKLRAEKGEIGKT